MSRYKNWHKAQHYGCFTLGQRKSNWSKKHACLCRDITQRFVVEKKTHAWYTRQVTNACQHFTKIFSFIIWLGLIIAWQFLLENVCWKNYCNLVSLLSTYFGANDSLITKINGFQSVTDILDLFLDLFWDWLCTSHVIHLEPWRVPFA